MTHREMFIDPIIEWIDETRDSKVWILAIVGCQDRHMKPILAKDKATVGRYIREHIDELLIFFHYLSFCYSEVDEIAMILGDIHKPTCDEAIYDESNFKRRLSQKVAEIFERLSDEEIVDEFYGYQVEGENSFKVCIQGPLELTRALGSKA